MNFGFFNCDVKCNEFVVDVCPPEGDVWEREVWKRVWKLVRSTLVDIKVTLLTVL